MSGLRHRAYGSKLSTLHLTWRGKNPFRSINFHFGKEQQIQRGKKPTKTKKMKSETKKPLSKVDQLDERRLWDRRVWERMRIPWEIQGFNSLFFFIFSMWIRRKDSWNSINPMDQDHYLFGALSFDILTMEETPFTFGFGRTCDWKEHQLKIYHRGLVDKL